MADDVQKQAVPETVTPGPSIAELAAQLEKEAAAKAAGQATAPAQPVVSATVVTPTVSSTIPPTQQTPVEVATATPGPSIAELAAKLEKEAADKAGPVVSPSATSVPGGAQEVHTAIPVPAKTAEAPQVTVDSGISGLVQSLSTPDVAVVSAVQSQIATKIEEKIEEKIERELQTAEKNEKAKWLFIGFGVLLVVIWLFLTGSVLLGRN